MTTIYYVYKYLREDGSPYYIGKGKDRRAYQPHKRSNGADITPKDTSRIEFIQQNLTEEQAFSLEDKLIKKYGRKSDGGILINMLLGPRGKSGRVFSHTEESKRKMSESRKGKMPSENTKKKMSESQKLRWENYDSAERDKKISESLKGRPQPEERRKKMSEAAKGRDGYWTGKKRPVVTCPHCGKSGADFVMSRWHFDNCPHQ